MKNVEMNNSVHSTYKPEQHIRRNKMTTLQENSGHFLDALNGIHRELIILGLPMDLRSAQREVFAIEKMQDFYCGQIQSLEQQYHKAQSTEEGEAIWERISKLNKSVNDTNTELSRYEAGGCILNHGEVM